MNYAYIRVSTNSQTLKNQKIEIRKYAKENKVRNLKFISETISGTKDYRKRKLGGLLTTLTEGDTLIITELSRLGRSLRMITTIFNELIEKKVTVHSIKENMTFKDNLESQVIIFAFGLSAQIERNLISERTKMGLQRAISEGKKLGRPPGRKSRRTKLTGKGKAIKRLISNGVSKSQIARLLNVSRGTLYTYLKTPANPLRGPHSVTSILQP